MTILLEKNYVRWTKSFAILEKALVFTDTLTMSVMFVFPMAKEFLALSHLSFQRKVIKK